MYIIKCVQFGQRARFRYAQLQYSICCFFQLFDFFIEQCLVREGFAKCRAKELPRGQGLFKLAVNNSCLR